MSADLETWLGVAALAAVTVATRLGGAALLERAALGPRLQRFVDGMAGAVLAALVATVLAQGGPREAAAVAAAVAAMLASGNVSVAVLAGMAAAAAWTGFA